MLSETHTLGPLELIEKRSSLPGREDVVLRRSIRADGLGTIADISCGYDINPEADGEMAEYARLFANSENMKAALEEIKEMSVACIAEGELNQALAQVFFDIARKALEGGE